MLRWWLDRARLGGCLWTLGLTAVSPTVAAADAGPAPRPVATFHDWSAAASEAQPPLITLDVVGDVVYFDPQWSNLWVVSQGASAYLAVGKRAPVLKAGQRIRLQGTFVPAPLFSTDDVRITVLEERVRPEPFDATGQAGEIDRLQHRFVRLDAIVEAQRSVDAHHVQLDLISEGVPFDAYVLVNPVDPVPLLAGSTVTIEGIHAPRYNDRGERLPNVVIWTNGFDAIQAHGPLTEDPRWQLPLQPWADLGTSALNSWVRLSGTLREPQAGVSFVLESGGRRLTARTGQRALPAAGETVEVIGWLRGQGESMTLEEALVPAALAAAAQPTVAPAFLEDLSQWWAITSAGYRNPVQLDTVLEVTFVDPGWRNMWVNNAGSGYYIGLGQYPVTPRVGDRLRVRGTVTPGENISLDQLDIEVLENVSLPEPPDATGRLTEVNQYRNRRVRVEGLVVSQEHPDETHLRLQLIADGLSIETNIVLQEGELVPMLAGSMIVIDGVYVPQNDPDGALSSLVLNVPSLTQLRHAVPLKDSRHFQRPISTIDRLGTLPAGEWVRISGTVQDHVSATSLLIGDANGQILAYNAQRLRLVRNDAVDVAGRVAREGGQLVLKDTYLIPKHGNGSGPLPTEFEELRSAAQVIALPPARAQAGLPVRLTGVVGWSHPSSRFFYLLDATRGVRVKLPPEMPVPPVGQGARVFGTTVPGAFASEVLASSVESGGVMGALTLPEPRVSTLEQALTGADEAQWVVLSGYVRSMEREGDSWRLAVLTPGGEFRAWVPDSDQVATLRGAIVRVQGVCAAIANERRQLTGVELWVPGANAVHVTEPAPSTPFALPLQSLASLQQFNVLQSTSRLVRVEATVVHQVPGRLVYAEDQEQSIRILGPMTERLLPGDRIEAVGLPGRDNSRLVLREAVYRRTGRGEESAALVLPSEQLLREDVDGRLVELQAVLRGMMQRGRDVRLMLQAGDLAFDALLLNHSDENLWAIGSELRLRGVYELIRDEYHAPRSLELQLRRVEDVQTVTQPPWLTSERALALSSAVIVVLLASLGWIRSLRRRVHAQTHEIRTQLGKVANLEARHRGIIESASDFIFTADLDGMITSINPAGERLTGYPRDEALRLHVRDLIATEDQAEGLAMLDLQTESDGSASFQCRFRRRDGELVWVETSARLLREDGLATGLLGVVRDVTARRQHEEALTLARDAAEASARAKSTFLANMSHEIRTPMNGVIGMSNLLLDTPLEPQQHEFAETIRNSAESLLTVLNDILDFSKIEAGKLQFEALDFDLNESVESTLELMAARAAAKGIELAAFVPTEVPDWVRGDPGRLRQVMLNLLGNAIKFTSEGEVVVRLIVEDQDEHAAQVRFEIQDTGIGLSAEAQANLFQPFAQGDSSTTRKFGGTGLGLAICKQIVELMGGQIGVHSEVGRGSTFWFTVPFPKSSPANRPESHDQVDTSHLLEGLRIAIIDDHATNRALLQHYSAAWGAHSECFASGAEALSGLRTAAASGQPFTLALLDFQMPEMNGLMLAHLMRNDPALQAIKCLLLTSIDQRFPAEELHEAGILQIMTKPIRRNELRAAIRAAVLHGELPPTKVIKPKRVDEPAVNPRALRVLVAEDNVVNQRVARLQLEKLGHRVDLVANGLEVLEALERAPYDLILMDCQMPEMDGYEATRQIRRGSSQSDILIVALTAHAMEGDREACLAAGMNDYLSKPVRLPGLVAIFEKLGPELDVRRVRRLAATAMDATTTQPV